jgi:outer membrane protein assembly factor BamB
MGWRSVAAAVSVSVGCSFLATGVIAQSWPQWRGPARDGVADERAAPVGWPSRLDRSWSVEAGLGHSSPVVADGRVFLHSRQGEDEAVSSLDLGTGRSLWSRRYPVAYEMHSAARSHGKGPKATPVLHEGRLYTFGISGVLSCWQAEDGALAWRRDLEGEFAASSPLYGAAMSPVIASGALVVHLGGHDDGALMAFDPVTGETRWSWSDDGPGYASPVIATLGGVEQVVTLTQSRVVGVALADGRLLWSIPFTTAYDQNAVTPVIRGELVIYSGLDRGVHAVRPVSAGGTWSVEPVWMNTEVSMYLSSPVLIGDRLFGFSHRDKGQFFCLDAREGRTLWTSRGRQAKNAALVASGDAVLALTSEGEMIVVSADGARFAPVATYSVAETATWAHPAVVGGLVLVKDLDTLTLWERRAGS